MWIGLFYHLEIDSWLWDGVASNVTYFNWGENEPNNYVSNKEAGVRIHSATNNWWDRSCAERFYYICEKGTGKFHLLRRFYQNNTHCIIQNKYIDSICM